MFSNFSIIEEVADSRTPPTLSLSRVLSLSLLSLAVLVSVWNDIKGPAVSDMIKSLASKSQLHPHGTFFLSLLKFLSLFSNSMRVSSVFRPYWVEVVFATSADSNFIWSGSQAKCECSDYSERHHWYVTNEYWGSASSDCFASVVSSNCHNLKNLKKDPRNKIHREAKLIQQSVGSLRRFDIHACSIKDIIRVYRCAFM